MDRGTLDGDTFTARFSSAGTELIRQLKNEPGVRAVTITEALPADGRRALVDIERASDSRGDNGPAESIPDLRPLVSVKRVDKSFFDVFSMRVLALDVGPDPHVSAESIQELARSVDPALRLDEFASLDSLIRQTHTAQYLLAAGIAAMTFSVLFLSAAGIHALMSVTLSQRRREIGIRLALGAPPYQLVKQVFQQAALGLAGGAAGGVLLALLIRRLAPEELVEARLPGVTPAAAAFMLLIGLVAAFGPVRRALR
jgi:predicted lysophospholipase L1 biosynthesis ABC-type transport system permease subunit